MHRYDEFIPFIQAVRDKALTVLQMNDKEFVEMLNQGNFMSSLIGELREKYIENGVSSWYNFKYAYKIDKLYEIDRERFASLEKSVTMQQYLIDDREYYLRQRTIGQVDDKDIKIVKDNKSQPIFLKVYNGG